jgi:hypothetical protein
MSPEEKIDAALRELPALDRASALVVSLIQDEPCVPAAVLTLVSVAARMARYLPPSQRARITWHLLECAEALDAQWN